MHKRYFKISPCILITSVLAWLIFQFLSPLHGQDTVKTRGEISVAYKKIKLQNGDLLFLDLDCGPLCDAIESVTKSYGGRHFSHVGLVFIQNDSTFIIEAIGKAVKQTWLPFFLKYSNKPATIGRLKNQNLVAKAIGFSISKLGFPYDDSFLYDNGRYYCSELLYDAFKEANGGKPVFKLEPMTYKKTGYSQFDPVWVDYFKHLGTEIPEGKPGCNPGGISLSEELEILGAYQL